MSERPIEVRPSLWETLLFTVLAAMLGGLMLGAAWAWRGQRLLDPVVILALIGAVAMTVLALAAGRSRRVRLTTDRIEKIELFDRESRPLDRITELRLVRNGEDGPDLHLTGPGVVTPMILPSYALRDARIRAWVDSLSQPEREALERKRAVLEADERLGDTPDERRRSLVWLRRLGRALDLMAIALAIWAFVQPEPYALVILALVLQAGLGLLVALWNRGLFVLLPDNEPDPRPVIGLSLFLPGLVIGLRGWLDTRPIESGPPVFFPAAFIAVALLGLALFSQGRPRPTGGVTLILAVVLFAGSWGGLRILAVLNGWSAP